MRRPDPRYLARLVLLLLVLPACGRRPPNQYLSGGCPVATGVRGYPVSASSDATGDTAFLAAVARAIASSFSAQVAEGTDKEPLTETVRAMDALLDQGNAFWRYDWRPAPADTARMLLTYRRGGEEPRISRAHPASPTKFEGSVERAAHAAVEWARGTTANRHRLPLVVPQQTSDSVVVEVVFGREPGAPSGTARFSVHEHVVRPMPGARPPEYPVSQLRSGYPGEVKVAFVILPDSTVDPESVQVLRASQPAFAAEVVRWLARARYIPAELDCRLVPTVGTQVFSFRIGMPALIDR